MIGKKHCRLGVLKQSMDTLSRLPCSYCEMRGRLSRVVGDSATELGISVLNASMPRIRFPFLPKACGPSGGNENCAILPTGLQKSRDEADFSKNCFLRHILL